MNRVDINEDGHDLEENESAPKKNAIPIQRRRKVTDLVIGRLLDKTSIVRKESIRLLARFVETHPFWLDGGSLDVKLLQDRLAEHKKLCEELTVSNINNRN